MLQRLLRHSLRGEPMSEDESGKSLDRLIAFSDGVFAFAMTLLVVNLTVPTLTGSLDKVNEELWNHLADQGLELFSYALSFWVIGRYWLIHHRMFRVVRRADGVLMTLNLLLLMFIALLPWPTEMLGRYGDTTAAVVAYSVVMACMGTASAILGWYIIHAGLIDERVTERYQQAARARSFMIPVAFILGIPVAFVDPAAGTYTWWIAIVVMSVLVHRRYGDVRDPYGGAGRAEATPSAGGDATASS